MDTKPVRLNLLKAIRAHAILWEKQTIPVHRVEVVKAWNAVAEQLEGRFSVPEIKYQWRNMKNTFKVCEKAHYTKNKKPTWFFYDKMNFIAKDFDGNLDNIDDWSELGDDDDMKYQDDDNSSDFDDEDDVPLKVDSTTKNLPKKNKKQRAELPTKKILKVTLERVSPRSTQVRTPPTTINYNNSDHQFLMSLVPYLSAIPTSRKLLVRSKIQKVIEEEEQKS